jgi:glycine cleavage system regulatory protein
VATFILTVLGDDRPGLVSALSAPIKAHDASWERSEMSRLAGKFAGIVVVTAAADRFDALAADFASLSEQGLHVVLERTDEPDDLDDLDDLDDPSDAGSPESMTLTLDLLGADRPGIVAEISASLAALDVNIEALSTGVRDAPMAGGTLFEAYAVLSAPPSASTDELRRILEGLADELMVDLTLTDTDTHAED